MMPPIAMHQPSMPFPPGVSPQDLFFGTPMADSKHFLATVTPLQHPLRRSRSLSPSERKQTALIAVPPSMIMSGGNHGNTNSSQQAGMSTSNMGTTNSARHNMNNNSANNNMATTPTVPNLTCLKPIPLASMSNMVMGNHPGMISGASTPCMGPQQPPPQHQPPAPMPTPGFSADSTLRTPKKGRVLKKPRTIFTDTQCMHMKAVFKEMPYITAEARLRLATSLRITEESVSVSIGFVLLRFKRRYYSLE